MAPTLQTVRKLEKFKNTSYPILSVYLSMFGEKSPSKKFLISRLHSLVHQYLSIEERKVFAIDIKKIESYILDEFDTRGRRTIAFFSAGKKLFETIEFEYYLPPLCVVTYSTYLSPITESLEQYNKYLVLLADREKARLFAVHLGAIEEQSDIFDGIVPQRVRANERDYYGRSDKILRHINDHLVRHFQLISQVTSDFVRTVGPDFIILGGHFEFLPKLKKHLTPSLRKMVLGEFVTSLDLSVSDILRKSKNIAENILIQSQRSMLP